MFLNFSKVFVCFLIVTTLYSPISFAAEGDPENTVDTAENITTDTSTETNNDKPQESTTSNTDTESVTINENTEISNDEFSEESTTTKDSVAVNPPVNNFLEAAQKNRTQRRAPVVSTSEISNAIDKDYSFLYDPNMKPDLITDMTNNPDNYVIMYLETGSSVLIKLKENIAPNTVIRFRKLVKEHFYDDMEIFRAIPDYLLQTGDPSGSGYGGKGVFYFAEINPDEKFKRGSVAMSNNGNLQSDDTQFFITFNSFDWLDGKYTIFGEVVLGMGKLEEVSKSFANDGFVSEPSIITKVELLSQRPKDRIDDLSAIIPPEKQIEAIKKQEENNRKEEARQKFMIESEKQKEALKSSLESDTTNNTVTTAPDDEASLEEQQSSQSNPYLQSRRRR